MHLEVEDFSKVIDKEFQLKHDFVQFFDKEKMNRRTMIIDILIDLIPALLVCIQLLLHEMQTLG